MRNGLKSNNVQNPACCPPFLEILNNYLQICTEDNQIIIGYTNTNIIPSGRIENNKLQSDNVNICFIHVQVPKSIKFVADKKIIL